MRALLKGKSKYLLLIPIFVFVLSTFYYSYATERVTEAILNEKHIDVSNHVKMLMMAIEATGDRHWEDLKPNIAACTEFINSMENVYSWAYKRANGGWELISEWKGPAEFVQLRETIMAKTKGNDSGSFTINYTPKTGPSRELLISYAQMPLYAPPEERYLVFTGISKFSLESSVPAWVNTGQWASMIISFGMNIMLLAWIEQARIAEANA